MQLDNFIEGDARNLISEIPRVDVTITSPPYWNLRNYGDSRQLGCFQKYDEYLDELTSILGKIQAKTSNTGSLWLILNTFRKRGRTYLLPFDIAQRLEPVGWHLKEVIIWDKLKSYPYSGPGKLRDNFEYILLFTKGKSFKFYLDRVRELDLTQWWVDYPERYNPLGKAPTNVWEFQIPTQGNWISGLLRHFNPFPPKLVERILSIASDEGDVVLDPFAGAGVTLAVAKAMKRHYIGFEIKRDYIRRFWNGVLPQVAQEITLSELKYAEHQELSRRLLKLRCLKYAQILAKRLKLQGYLIHSIFVAAEDLRKPDIYPILIQEQEDPTPIIKEITGKPPLSKFGISPKVTPLSWSDSISVLEEIFKGERLYLYRKHHYWIGRKTATEWLLAGRERNIQDLPHILSNIGIYQPEPHLEKA